MEILSSMDVFKGVRIRDVSKVSLEVVKLIVIIKQISLQPEDERNLRSVLRIAIHNAHMEQAARSNVS